MNKTEKKVLLSSGVGSILEMYDYSLYAFFAPVLGPLFFPTDNQVTSLIATFSVFALGYLMRPFGAALFGNFGDKLGRKKILVLSVLLMGIPTVLIGCLPTYQQVGPLAIILMLVVRLIQGIAVGSEFAGATIFMGEHSRPQHRGFLCSWIVFGIFVGLLLGSGAGAIVSALLTQEQLMAWGWRIPFWTGFIIVPVALYIRRHIPESPVFEEMRASNTLLKLPVIYLIRHHLWQMVQSAGVIWICAASVGIIFVYMSSHLSTVLSFELTDALAINSINTVLLAILIPIAGALSDRIGRRPLLIAGSLGLACSAYPLFLLINHTDSLFTILCAESIFAIFSACVLGTFGSTITELFPSKVRYSGVSISYNVMSGTGPLIASYLVYITHNPASPSFYLIFSACVSLVFAFLIRETKGKTL